MTKRIGIIGSGRFGEALIQALAAQGAEVLLMDTDRRKIQELSEYVTKAIEGDATNIHALEEAGFGLCDTVVVAIGENIEGSVMATVNCKDLGVRTVVAKAATEVHGRVLRRVGADVVIFPNRDRAVRLARSFACLLQWRYLPSQYCRIVQNSLSCSNPSLCGYSSHGNGNTYWTTYKAFR